MSETSILDRISAMTMDVVNNTEETVDPDAVDDSETTEEVEAEATNEPDPSPTESEAEEQDSSAEATEEPDPLEQLRKELAGGDDEEETGKEPSIELDSDAEYVLNEVRRKYRNPEDQLRHLAQQEVAASRGFEKLKQERAELIELAKSQYPEFDEGVHRPFVERELKDQVVAQKGFDADELKEWLADNESLFSKAVSAEIASRKERYNQNRTAALNDLEAKLGKTKADLDNRRHERINRIQERAKAFDEQVGDDPTLRHYLMMALSDDSERAPKSDKQRFLDAQKWRNEDVAKTLEKGAGLDDKVVAAAMRAVLRDKRMTGLLRDILSKKADPAKPTPTKPITQVETKTAAAEERPKANASAGHSRLKEDDVLARAKRSVASLLNG